MSVKYTCPLCEATKVADAAEPSPICPDCRILMIPGLVPGEKIDPGATVAAPGMPASPGRKRLKVARPLKSSMPPGAMQTQPPGFLAGEAGFGPSPHMSVGGMPRFDGGHIPGIGPDYEPASGLETQAGSFFSGEDGRPGQTGTLQQCQWLLENARRKAAEIISEAEDRGRKLAGNLPQENRDNPGGENLEEKLRGEFEKKYSGLIEAYRSRIRELTGESPDQPEEGGEDPLLAEEEPAALQERYDDCRRMLAEAEERCRSLALQNEKILTERDALWEERLRESGKTLRKFLSGRAWRYFFLLHFLVLISCYFLFMGLHLSGWESTVSWCGLVLSAGYFLSALISLGSGMRSLTRQSSAGAVISPKRST